MSFTNIKIHSPKIIDAFLFFIKHVQIAKN
jgi:hypothetical protein